jgi:hypothetical protein
MSADCCRSEPRSAAAPAEEPATPAVAAELAAESGPPEPSAVAAP